uniref:Uncharacterized protein n=1 Tax=Romanomermis culicivorax TaxID=13658 RepID=A0A915HGR4_ROMCU
MGGPFLAVTVASNWWCDHLCSSPRLLYLFWTTLLNEQAITTLQPLNILPTAESNINGIYLVENCQKFKNDFGSKFLCLSYFSLHFDRNIDCDNIRDLQHGNET